MDLTRYPFRCLVRHAGRTAGLVVLTALLTVAALGGTLVVSALTSGLSSLEARLGADVICAPRTAKSTHDLEEVLLSGTPASFYMDRSILDTVAATEGVERVSPQYYLATAKAGCCAMPIQIIGYDPKTDFTIAPWVDHSLGHDIKTGEVVVGCDISGAPGAQIMFYGVSLTIAGKLDETGTALDTAAFCDVETVRTLIEGSVEQGIAVLADAKPESVISTVQVKVADGYDAETVAGDINVHLRDVWAVSAKAMTSGVADSIAGVARVVSVLAVCVCVLAAIVLTLVCFVAAGRRTREFGVIAALGASRRELLGIVATEALVTSAAGALIGAALALLIMVSFAGALETALGLPFLMPEGAAMMGQGVVCVVVAVVVSLVASLAACLRLVRVDASQILREG